MAFTYRAVSNKFQPRSRQAYYFIGVSKKNQLGLLIGKRVWTGDKHDRARMAVNNVFSSLEAASAVQGQIAGTLKAAQLS